jgi:exosortase N
MIVTGSSEFSVDPACMGLYMLASSMLAGLILIAVYQKNLGRKINIWSLMVALKAILVLNIICNLLRIICLVYFNIVPGSFLHEAMGIICFVLYVIIPSTYIIGFLVTRFGEKPPLTTNARKNILSKSVIFQNFFLLALTMTVIILCKNMTVNSRLPQKTLTIEGYTSTKLTDGITRLQSANALIYVKPIAGFYSSDHQPMICWKGSGYQFKQFKETI